MKITLALIVAHKLHRLEWSKGTVDTPPSGGNKLSLHKVLCDPVTRQIGGGS
ncbi:hypothetical protein F441_22229, partial [Phytophthora nicotianae CJ01A1]